MLFYVPPLSPVTTAASDSAPDTAHLFEDIDSARVPIRYLAALLGAGSEDAVRYALRKEKAVRWYRRGLAQPSAASIAERMLREADCSETEAEAIYRLTALSSLEEASSFRLRSARRRRYGTGVADPAVTGMDSLLDGLAALVEYPDAEFTAALRRCSAAAREATPEVAALVDRFGDETAFVPLGQLQEAYAEAFDLDPACALDLGWHLHGEHRERGEMLATLRERLRAAGVAESSQLPDHLTHVLLLMARQPAEERALLVAVCAPVLERIRDGLRCRGSVYAPLIEAVYSAIALCGTVAKG